MRVLPTAARGKGERKMPELLGIPSALLLCVVLGYLLGSVNTSIIVTRIFQNGADIREQGSGNAGMTNVIRTVGKKAGAITFAGDFLKCVLACLLARLTLSLLGSYDTGESLQYAMYLTGAACVFGHIFPVFFGFRGGKAVATSSAMMLMTDWRVFLLILATFLLIFLWKRVISLASVICAVLYPVYTFILTCFVDHGTAFPILPYFAKRFTLIALGVGLLVLWKHRSNIKRLIKGEEKPITAKQK